MARIRSEDTKPELMVRSLLHHLGFRFRLHHKELPSCPDIVLPKYRAVILVHGCFWHFHAKCRDGKIPASNKKYWEGKLKRNVVRDKLNLLRLKAQEWRVLVIWECEINQDINKVARKINKFLLA
jgi:DNA mismatch endonuclease, patch repair protein